MGWIDVLATVLALALGLALALELALAHLQIRGSLAIDRRARLGGVNEPAESRYDTWEWRSLAAIAKRRAGMRCEDCGSDGPLDAHHIRPVGEGGAFWDLANLRALCRNCHQARHPDWVDDGEVDAGLDWWMAEGERMYAERNGDYEHQRLAAKDKADERDRRAAKEAGKRERRAFYFVVLVVVVVAILWPLLGG